MNLTPLGTRAIAKKVVMDSVSQGTEAYARAVNRSRCRRKAPSHFAIEVVYPLEAWRGWIGGGRLSFCDVYRAISGSTAANGATDEFLQPMFMRAQPPDSSTPAPPFSLDVP
jgi:hypothetical protein